MKFVPFCCLGRREEAEVLAKNAAYINVQVFYILSTIFQIIFMRSRCLRVIFFLVQRGFKPFITLCVDSQIKLSISADEHYQKSLARIDSCTARCARVMQEAQGKTKVVVWIPNQKSYKLQLLLSGLWLLQMVILTCKMSNTVQCKMSHIMHLFLKTEYKMHHFKDHRLESTTCYGIVYILLEGRGITSSLNLAQAGQVPRVTRQKPTLKCVLFQAEKIFLAEKFEKGSRHKY